MNFDLVAPCKHCPFRTDVTPYLRTDRVREICDSITDYDMTFACHKTTSHDDEGEHIPSSKEQHCAGATIMLEKMQQPNQAMRIAAGRWFDPSKLKMDAPVYDTPDQMVEAYRKANARSR